jgi:two-component system chemotaxis sensor kinase CheA
MKLQLQDWTRLADVSAARTARRPGRRLPLIGAPRAIEAAPMAATAPLLALLLLGIALPAWWLLAAGHGPQGLLLGAAAAAILLLPVILYRSRRAQASAVAAAAAQRQVANILGCMREGLFLIGRDRRLTASCSQSLIDMLRLNAPAGLRFEDVLRPLLDEKTLAAALNFLQLLWQEQRNEEPVELFNPLSQVEVAFANAHGGSERRYLSFSLRRVHGDGPADDYLLGTVADVTDRVLLARELEHTKADRVSQAGLLLQLVRADPVALVAFLDDADTALRKSNALLTAAGSEQQHLQKKLNGVLRELHAVAAAAEALPLASFAQRLRRIDELLSALCAKTSLIGNDFLPVVIRLDELMSHAATMRSIYQHIVLLRAASAALAALEQRESTLSTEPGVLEAS